MKLLVLFAAISLMAQNPAVPRREALVARAEIAPAGHTGRHKHAGEEIGYVIEGELELLIEGQPPRDIKAGESFIVPAGVTHDGQNQGTVSVKFVGVMRN